MKRYSRQILFEAIGRQGQQRLGASRAVLIGCGALGTVLADIVVRAGVGHLRIIDRDALELSNLQRQVLFDEGDVAARLPKAIAARRKLQVINSEVTVEGIVDDANYANIESLIHGADVILDGTDNFDARFLINDAAIKHHIPWIYGACVSTYGLVMPIIPGETPCLACVFEHAPPPELSPTCDTVGVLAPAVNVIASLQAIEALKILSGNIEACTRKLISVDVWSGRFAVLEVATAADRCPACRDGVFAYLDGRHAQSAAVLCGRNAVQIKPSTGLQIELAALAHKLHTAGCDPVHHNEFMLQASVEGCELTVFPTGRAIIKGTSQPHHARTIYARYVGA